MEYTHAHIKVTRCCLLARIRNFRIKFRIYRGRRAGRLVKEREATRLFKINTVQSSRREIKRAVIKSLRTHNPTNCTYIPLSSTVTNANLQTRSENVFLPSVLLSNVTSLAPKIDEVRHYAHYANLDLICLTETWLHCHIQDSVVSINGFNLIRKDRQEGSHGGVCVFIKDLIPFIVLEDLSESPLEVLWIKLRPTRLPRGVNNIVLGIVYHPPSSSDFAMLEYLTNCLSTIESRYPNSGIILLGDFNQLNIASLNRSYNLKQIVKFQTRGSNTLDLVLTNLKELFKDPIKRAPFGLSDHVSVEVQPQARSHFPPSKQKVKSRDMRASNRLAVRSYLELVDVASMLNSVSTCEEKVSLFEEIVKTGLDHIIPLRSKTIHLSKPPWMNSTLKRLIRSRQIALAQGNHDEFRRLRNRVNRERKTCRSKYYHAKVQHLKESKPSLWWKEVKKLSGMTPTAGTRDDLVNLLQHLELNASSTDLANMINSTFLTPMNTFQPLLHDANDELPLNYPALVVTADDVYKELSSLIPTKAHGPDGIPTWLLKENADLLADSVKDILNHSYSTGRLPKSWKKADIVPIPKKKPISDVNKHLRPISLTSILSKIGEGFVVRDFVKPAVLKKIGNEQFGTVPKSSTTQALISMLHCWNKATDGSGSSVRVVLFDFKKAFDLIDHNILKRKLSNYDLPPCIVCWILDFLTDRKQRVKLSNDCYSEWGTVPAGVPQGTKLGPWLYLIMINTVGVAYVDQWKYVDDTTVAETVLKNDVSAMQEYVEDLSNQSLANKFQLNETKCKELRISFAKFKPDFAPIRINDKDIEVVTSVKLLGLNISNDLMRESNRNLDIPPPGIPGEFACLVFEEGGNLTFFSSGRWGICLGVGNLNFSFKHVC